MEDIDKRIEKLEQYVTHHEEDIKNNRIGISSNSQRIETNTGALALLHTLNANSNKYFIIWIITFIAFLFSIGYIIYLKTEYSRVDIVEASEVEQSNDSGDNNYIGRDGDINGYTKD